MPILDPSVIKVFKGSGYGGLVDNVIKSDRGVFIPSLIKKYGLQKNGAPAKTSRCPAGYALGGRIRILHTSDDEINEFDSALSHT